MRKTLVVTIDLEGAALAEDFGDYEAQRLLKVAADRAMHLFDLGDGGWKTGHTYPILDSNGNACGRVGVVETEERLRIEDRL